MGYENFFGILEFDSAPVPGIKTDRSLNTAQNILSKDSLWQLYVEEYLRIFWEQSYISGNGNL